MPSNVRDIDAIREFRSQLMRFMEEVEGALQSLSMEMHRGTDWIEHDRPQYWKQQIRRAYDAVATTRSALMTCQMRTVAGHRSACLEEKQALAKAKRRLEECEEKLKRIKSWQRKMAHDVNELRGRLAGLRRLLDTDIPKALALLERTTEILESYAEIQRPQSEGD